MTKMNNVINNASHDSFAFDGKIVLPLPPQHDNDHKFEMDIYVRFMRHLRQVPNSRHEIKVLSSIQFTADMLDISDALVAKALVDMGLRAPRNAFPMAFLDFADKCAQRISWELNTPPAAVIDLVGHWERHGEDIFRPQMNRVYSVINENNACFEQA